MINLINYIRNNYKKITPVFLFCFLFFFVFQAGETLAFTWETVAEGIQKGAVKAYGELISFLVYLIGQAMGLVIAAMVEVASYNRFIREGVIVGAWVQVRNFSNMFFVLAMLVIAFATMFRYENYAIKRALPKLIIMAFLINFSRTICGLVIDASQLVMATFLSSVGTNGSSYVTALGINKYLDMVVAGSKLTGDTAFWESVAGLTIGFIFTLIASVVLLVILVTLLMRIVFLWIYVILSPLAFMLYAFPGGQGRFSTWLSEFTRYVLIGPLLAFFVWLALMVGSQGQMTEQLIGAVNVTNVAENATENDSSKAQFSANKMMNTANFIHFIIAIGLLVGGLKVSQDIGGDAGRLAGKGLGAINQGRDFTVKLGKRGAKGVGKRAGQVAGSGSLALVSRVAGDKNPVGKLAANWNEGLIKDREKKSKAKRLKLMKNLGMNEDARGNVGEIANSRTARRVKESVQKVGSAAAITAGLAVGNPLAAVAGAVAGAGILRSAIKSRKNREGRNKYDDVQKERDKKTKASETLMRETKMRNDEKHVANKIKIDQDLVKNKASNERSRDRSLEKIEAKLAQDISSLPAALSAADRKREQEELRKDAKRESSKVESDYIKKNRQADINHRDELKTNDQNKQANDEVAEVDHKNRLRDIVDGSSITEKKDAVNKNRSDEIEGINKGLTESIAAIPDDLDVIERKLRADKLTKNAEKKKLKINEDADKQIKELSNPFEDYKDYHPNKLIMGAVKEGEKESETAKKRVDALAAGNDGTKFGAGSMYSADGQTATQKKMIETLSDNSDKSVEAVKHLEASMRTLLNKQESGASLSSKEQENIKAWKQGIAAADKGGVNISGLSSVVDTLNQIKAKGEDSPKSVDDYKAEVIKN